MNKQLKNNRFSKIKGSTIKAIGVTWTLGAIMVCANEAMAADDAFKQALTKISGWTSGSLGKLITFISLIGGAIMGALGFSWKTVAGPIGIGLVLSMANAITNLFFT